MIGAMQKKTNHSPFLLRLRALAWAFLACLGLLFPPSFAQSANRFARFDLAGVYPGLSGPATVSFFAKSLPGWRLPDSEDAAQAATTLTDALSNDCPLVGPSVWTCVASLRSDTPSDPVLIEAQARYRSTGVDPRSRSLSRFRLRLGWDAPAVRGWEDFLLARSAPDSADALPPSKALKAFSASEPLLALASTAKRFRGALWRLRAPDGSLFEIAAVAALDANGALIALACETSAPEATQTSPALALP